MNRYTLRIFDGERHYDFPCHKESDSPEIFHSIRDNYPIKAVRENSGRYEFLRNVSRIRKKCTVLDKIKWRDPWQVQMFYYENGDNTSLYITGSTMEVIDPLDKSNTRIIEFTDSDTVVEANFEDMDFNIEKHSGYRDMNSPKSRISNMYNEIGHTLILGFNTNVSTNLSSKIS